MGDDPQAAASQKKRKINAEERREQDRLAHRRVRSVEPEAKRTQRLKRARQDFQKRVASESADDKEKRRSRDRDAKKRARQSDSPEQKLKRLEKHRLEQQKSRNKKTKVEKIAVRDRQLDYWHRIRPRKSDWFKREEARRTAKFRAGLLPPRLKKLKEEKKVRDAERRKVERENDVEDLLRVWRRISAKKKQDAVAQVIKQLEARRPFTKRGRRCKVRKDALKKYTFEARQNLLRDYAKGKVFRCPSTNLCKAVFGRSEAECVS